MNPPQLKAVGILQQCLLLAGASGWLAAVLPGLVQTSPEHKRRDKLKTTGVALDHLASPLVVSVSPLRIHEVWGVGKVPRSEPS